MNPAFHTLTNFAQLVSAKRTPPLRRVFEKHYIAKPALYSFSISGKDIAISISFYRYLQTYIN